MAFRVSLLGCGYEKLIKMNKIIAFFLLTTFLTGCAEHTKDYIGIIHDYEIRNAITVCIKHEGLHYIVPHQKMEVDKEEQYPCEASYSVRCQDGTLIKVPSEVKYCFISKMQLEESK
jgi:hypothetical protein